MTSTIKKILSSGLNLKIATTVMLSIVLVEIIILVPSLFHQKHHKEMMAEKHALILISSIESSLKYNNNVEDSELYESLLSFHDLVKGYAVCNHTGCPIKFGEKVSTFNVNQPEAKSLTSDDKTRLETTKKIMNGEQPYWVILRTDISDLESDLFHYILRILGLVFVICLFVTLTTTTGLMWLVIRPIQALKGNIQNLLADPNNPLKYIQREHSQDEIGDLTKTFNRLLFDINNYQELVRRSQEEVQKGLSASEARWKFALEGSGDGVWDWNPVTDDIFFSKQFLESLGYNEGEFITKMESWWPMLHPKDLAPSSTAMTDHLKGKTDFYSMEHRVKHNNGDWVWSLSRGIVITRDKHGNATRVVGTQTDISAHKETEALIWRQANIDLLTGLPNRRLFQAELNKSIKRRQRRTMGPLVLMLLDLDNFKTINDTHGHQVGDALLKHAAKRLNRCVKDNGIAARLGGDEFTVVLEEVRDKKLVNNIANSILTALSEPFPIGIETFHVSASIGITCYPEDAEDIDTLIMNADQAMYASKEHGRNCFHYFSHDMRTMAKERMRAINELREALEKNQFEVFYQPVIDFESERIVKAEALIRWNHPTRGVVGADDIIPLSEETGLIVAIGNWVFNESIKQLAQWQQDFEPTLELSVNTSPVQYYHNDCVVSEWYETMDSLNIPYHHLVVEITESLMLDIDDNVAKKLNAFREGGVKIALDDFGTGYSSLAYLKDLNSDFLKIDRSFVCNIAENNKNLALCLEIIKIAHIFGMKVIAEGIETQEQAWLLADGGCDFAQGYFYSKPVSAKEFEALLIRQKALQQAPKLAANHL